MSGTIYSFSRWRHNPTKPIPLTSQTKLTLTLTITLTLPQNLDSEIPRRYLDSWNMDRQNLIRATVTVRVRVSYDCPVYDCPDFNYPDIAGEFHCPDIVGIPLHVTKCLYVGNRACNSSHCMSGTWRAGRKNITSGTQRAVSNTKRQEVSFFYAHKRCSPFFLYIPHKKPFFKPINDQLIVAGICWVQQNQPTLYFGR